MNDIKFHDQDGNELKDDSTRIEERYRNLVEAKGLLDFEQLKCEVLETELKKLHATLELTNPEQLQQWDWMDAGLCRHCGGPTDNESRDCLANCPKFQEANNTMVYMDLPISEE